MSSDPQGPDDEFVRQLTSHQARLQGLIYSMLPDAESARDVLQETNVVLWRKSGEFEPGTNFGAWAATVAYYQVAAFRKTRGRDRLYFDDDLLASISNEAEKRFGGSDDRTVALESCLERLGPQERDMLRQRYAENQSIVELAGQLDKTANATRVALFRLRHLLMECIQAKTNPSA